MIISFKGELALLLPSKLEELDELDDLDDLGLPRGCLGNDECRSFKINIDDDFGVCISLTRRRRGGHQDDQVMSC